MKEACFIIYADGEGQANDLRKILDRCEIGMFLSEPQTRTLTMFITDWSRFEPGSIGNFAKWLAEMGIKDFQVKIR